MRKNSGRKGNHCCIVVAWAPSSSGRSHASYSIPIPLWESTGNLSTTRTVETISPSKVSVTSWHPALIAVGESKLHVWYVDQGQTKVKPVNQIQSAFFPIVFMFSSPVLLLWAKPEQEPVCYFLQWLEHISEHIWLHHNCIIQMCRALNGNILAAEENNAIWAIF